ncbi:uncharacterized protein EV420DRAFT_834954 [Desarmillaria tabescens]|uniref:F-box domain-containing protein n=1 Tax=Armillaria tabescens TaxID=1929756 RepID=A0AA39MWT8_ARMTA|nr:uncharacterized protein EV420DRAFT_834954 [Desarmillaria tabescens]KAK0448939.1 hypothetical protein EV420DRAFT_834954 [Desarmillaria tabescens]
MTTPFKDSVPVEFSLSIPQELFDYILDFLYDGAPTLLACSLICRASLPCSCYHIYSSVFIVHICEFDKFREQYAGQLYHHENLATLLQHSPSVASLVTRFGIHAMLNAMMDPFDGHLSLAYRSISP